MNNGVTKDFFVSTTHFLCFLLFFIDLIEISKHMNDEFTNIMIVSAAEMCVRNFKVTA